MLSNKQIICPNNLLDASIKKKGATAAIVNAGKPLPMQSVMDAVKEDLIKPIFIGDKDQIQKCANEIQFDISGYEVIHEPVENNTAAVAAKLAMQGKVKIIVKGHIHTDILMKEVLKREYKLLGKTRLSHVWHMTLEKDDKCFTKCKNKNAYIKKRYFSKKNCCCKATEEVLIVFKVKTLFRCKGSYSYRYIDERSFKKMINAGKPPI